MHVCIHHWNLCIRNKSYMAINGMSFSVRKFHEIILHTNVPFWVSHYIEWLCHLFLIIVYFVGHDDNITGQIVGNACGFKVVNFSLNLNVRNTTWLDFILYSLNSQLYYYNKCVRRRKNWTYYVMQRVVSIRKQVKIAVY